MGEAVDSRLATSSKRSGKPIKFVLNDRSPDPHHTVLWIDNDKPRWKKSKVDGTKPS